MGYSIGSEIEMPRMLVVDECRKYLSTLPEAARPEYLETIQKEILPRVRDNPQAAEVLEGIIKGFYDFLDEPILMQ